MNGRMIQTILSSLAVLLLGAMAIGMFNFSQEFAELRVDVKYLSTKVTESIAGNLREHVGYERRLRTLEFGTAGDMR